MVIYSTTNDKPVLGRMTFCQMLTKSHSVYRGETKKLLQLRDGGILLSSHQHKPPFFRFPPPPIDIYEFQVYNYFSTLFILAFGRVVI